MIDQLQKTGRQRYRIERRWRRPPMLVLQVEEEGTEVYWIGGAVDSRFVRRWRDATIGDLTTHIHGVRYGDDRLVRGGP